MQRAMVLDDIVRLIQPLGPFQLSFHDGRNLLFGYLVPGHGALHLQFRRCINDQGALYQVFLACLEQQGRNEHGVGRLACSS